MKTENGLVIEAFIQNCLINKKTIIIPSTKQGMKPYISHLKRLFKGGLMTQTYYDKKIKEISEYTLDNKTYQQYHKCLKILNKSQKGLSIKPPNCIY
jgi:hypothetical protein